MAGAGRKVFTAGDVLTASQVQDYLQDQTVMNFAGTAARSSAIASPTDGMVTYNQTNDSLEAYNGTAWMNMGGLQLIKSQTIGTTVSSVTVSNAFSTLYDNYKIIITGGVMAAENVWSLRLGSVVTGYYAGLTTTTYGGTTTNVGYSNQASIFVGAGSTASFNSNIEIGAPFLTKASLFAATFSRITTTAGGYGANLNGFLNDATSHTDFTITTTSTWTGGTIYVYGYVKG